MPGAGQYGVTLEQQLAGHFVLSVGYVGTQGRHLLRQATPNLGPNAILATQAFNVTSGATVISGVALGPGQRINAQGQRTGARPVANSRYDSLQVQARGRRLQVAF